MQNKVSAYRGCLLGMAVGDAMGYPVDKKSWDEICEDYGPNGLLGYDLVNGSADITSYTQMAAFVCNGLLLGAIRGNPDKYSRFLALGLREWAKSQQFRGAAEKTFCWLAQVPEMRRRFCVDTRMLDALSREVLGTPESPVFQSAFPSALTTAVAVGLCRETARLEPQQIGRLGAEAVALTHGDPEAFLSGAFLAYSIAGILNDPQMPVSSLFLRAAEAVCQQFAETYPQAELLKEKVQKALALTKDPELTPLASMTLLGCSTASECVAGAVYACTIHIANFDEAMIVAVNHSGRSGAVGAITGALMGARLGVDALPEFYLESLETADILSELAEDLAQTRPVTRIFDDNWDQKYVQGRPIL
jgi:ADP-ribosylglycohydrolase